MHLDLLPGRSVDERYTTAKGLDTYKDMYQDVHKMKTETYTVI